MGFSIEQLRALGVSIDRVSTFAELKRICDVFKDGHNGRYPYPFLMIFGNPGVSKSFRFELEPGYFAGDLSKIGIYTHFYRHRDESLIFDEVDALFRDKGVVSLMKTLMNDRSTKKISWGKRDSKMEADGIPNSFETSSRCCIILNELPRAFGLNDLAVLSRGKVVFFKPDVHEVHSYVGSWNPKVDKAVFEWIGKHKHLITVPHCRWYLYAMREKNAGVDWKSWLLDQWTNSNSSTGLAPYMTEIANLLATHSKPGDQLNAWKALGHGHSKSSFHRWKSEFQAVQGGKNKIALPIFVNIPKSQ